MFSLQVDSTPRRTDKHPIWEGKVDHQPLSPRLIPLQKPLGGIPQQDLPSQHRLRVTFPRLSSGSVCLDVINQTWTPMYELVNIFEVVPSNCRSSCLSCWRTRTRLHLSTTTQPNSSKKTWRAITNEWRSVWWNMRWTSNTNRRPRKRWRKKSFLLRAVKKKEPVHCPTTTQLCLRTTRLTSTDSN